MTLDILELGYFKSQFGLHGWAQYSIGWTGSAICNPECCLCEFIEAALLKIIPPVFNFPDLLEPLLLKILKELLCFELVRFNKKWVNTSKIQPSKSSLYIHIFWITELWTRPFFFSFWSKGKHRCFQLIIFSVKELHFHIELQPAVHYICQFFLYLYKKINWYITCSLLPFLRSDAWHSIEPVTQAAM